MKLSIEEKKKFCEETHTKVMTFYFEFIKEIEALNPSLKDIADIRLSIASNMAANEIINMVIMMKSSGIDEDGAVSICLKEFIESFINAINKSLNGKKIIISDFLNSHQNTTLQ